MNFTLKVKIAYLPFAKRKSANSLDLLKVAVSWIGGPKTGTSLDLVTATLKIKPS